MLDRLRALWANNPVRVTAILASIVVFVAAKLGVVVDEQNVGEALAIALPIVLGGEVARSQVTPYVGEIGPPSDELLDLEQAPRPDDPSTPTFNEATGDFRRPGPS